jgi:hypothetical protein
MRPELFRGALLRVPFVDLINTMLDESLPLTVGEFEEWGNPKIREHYEYMKTYCPYTNLAPRPFPALLVRTALNDSQVMYWEPAKWVARLRALGHSPGPGPQSAALQDQHGGGPRRRLRPLRLSPRDCLRLCVVVGGGRPRGVIDGAKLLGYLRKETGASGLGLAEPPVPVTGGFDTSIYAFHLVGAPLALSGRSSFACSPRTTIPGARCGSRPSRTRSPRRAIPRRGAPGLRGPGRARRRLRHHGAPSRPLPARASRAGHGGRAGARPAPAHSMDAEAVRQAIEAAVPGGAQAHMVEGQLAQMEARIVRSALLGLVPALGWLRANRPTTEGPAVVCHGDFHPQNVLVSDRREITGVLDWPNVLLADRACDVAASRVILRYAPVGIAGVPLHLRWLLRAARAVLVRRFMAGHRRAQPLDRDALRYYEAFACMRGLVRVAENRTAADVGVVSSLTRLDSSRYGERLARRFGKLTGITPRLPRVKESKVS